MSSTRFLPALAASIALSGLSLAAAEKAPQAETVAIEIDADASASQMYESIRKQAFQACKSERGAHTVSARANGRSECARDIAAQVIENLELPQLTAYAESRLGRSVSE